MHALSLDGDVGCLLAYSAMGVIAKIVFILTLGGKHQQSLFTHLLTHTYKVTLVGGGKTPNVWYSMYVVEEQWKERRSEKEGRRDRERG